MPKISNPLDLRNRLAIGKAAPLYDRINKVWAKTEEFFRSKGILAPVAYRYDCDNQAEYLIGLQKFGGKWRVCYGHADHQRPDQDAVWTMITDCPVEDRVELLRYVPNLFEQLVKTNEAVLPMLEKAANDAEETLRKLGLE